MRTTAAIAVGFILDLIIGDPSYPFHPVVLMGKGISWLEKILRKVFPKTEKGELMGGTILALIITVVTYTFGYLIIHLAGRINSYVSFAAECIIAYQCIAVKAMLKESENVLAKVKTGDIKLAGQAVKRIVGRDTEGLDMKGVIRADIECLAESLCDGVIAPVFFLIAGGIPLGLAYKAVNTMDSMIGYKNDRYLYFGRTAARLDDIAGFIPARLSALLIVLLSFMGGDGGRSFRIWRRDRYRHASPNSGQTEAAMAGALNVRLGGPAKYFGQEIDKAYIGDDIKTPGTEEIQKAEKVFKAASILGIILLFFARAVIYVNLKI